VFISAGPAEENSKIGIGMGGPVFHAVHAELVEAVYFHDLYEDLSGNFFLAAIQGLEVFHFFY